MTTSSNIEKITKISFISLGTLPLLKESYNSILIIICAVFVVFNLISSKKVRELDKRFLILTSLFWAFLIYEVLAQSFNFNRILRHLPFLVFPLIFTYKPKYINDKIRLISIKVFQISVFFQSIIYLLFFLRSNSFNQLFYASLESIPFFREYVFNNYYFEIHPTYFSTFLLVSFTISIYNLFIEKKGIALLHVTNTIVTLFFIFLFSSKMILILVVGTIFVVLAHLFLKKNIKRALLVLSSTILILTAIIYPSRTILLERFDEVRTEINEPIVGTYYNSTNTRIAILKCSLILFKKAPLFGYGDDLQESLNNCYANTNDSEFYKIHVFNTHNYYFNLILYGGWLFLFLFLIYLLFIYRHIGQYKLAVLLFLQFLVINMTENFFSRHYGIVLFNFIICLFIYIDKANEGLANE